MKQLLTKLSMLLLVAGALLLGACDGIINPPDLQDVNATIRAMDYFQQELPLEEPIRLTENIAPDDSAYPDRPPNITGYYNAVYMAKDAREHEDLISMNPSSSVLWLGEIFDGNTITTGQYLPISAARGPLSFSISGPYVNQPAITIPVATRSAVTTGISQIVTSGVIGNRMNNSELFQASIYSEEQFALAIGASFKSGFVDFKAGFDFSRTEVRSRVFMKFEQEYFTLTCDNPVSPIEFFAPGTTWNDLAGQITTNVSPVFVKSIKYGRIGIICVESSYTEEEVKAAFHAAYNAIVVSGSVDIDSTYQQIIDESHTYVRIIGGSTTAGQGVVDLAGFINWLQTGSTEEIITDGAPISYVLHYMKNYALARVVLADEYWVRETTPISNKFRIRVMSMVSTGQYNLAIDHYCTVNAISGYGTEQATLDTLYQSTDGDILYKDTPTILDVSHDYIFDSNRMEEAYITLSANIWGCPLNRKLTIQQVLDDIAAYGVPADNPNGCYYFDFDHPYAQCDVRFAYVIEPY